MPIKRRTRVKKVEKPQIEAIPNKPPEFPNLKIRYQDPHNLIPYPKNSKIHPQDQIDRIKRAIIKVGFIGSIIVDDDNVVLAGNGATTAAIQLDLKKVPTINVSHLNEEQKRFYVVSDNRLNELSTWDMGMLEIEMLSLEEADFDVELIEDLDFKFKTVSIEQVEVDEDEDGGEQQGKSVEIDSGAEVFELIIELPSKRTRQELKKELDDRGYSTINPDIDDK